jgi:hypothetical protein
MYLISVDHRLYNQAIELLESVVEEYGVMKYGISKEETPALG